MHGESHIGNIYAHSANCFEQILVNHKIKTSRIFNLIIIQRLIQSQRQARSLSSAGREEDPDRGFGFVGKKSRQFLARVFTYIDHYSSKKNNVI